MKVYIQGGRVMISLKFREWEAIEGSLSTTAHLKMTPWEHRIATELLNRAGKALDEVGGEPLSQDDER